MKRDKIAQLFEWKNRENRKPLIVQGARQTGKTWLLKEFGKQAFQQTLYINFEEQPPLRSLFQNDFDVKRILDGISIFTQSKIVPETTLIIFDEIQSAEHGLTALKYFQENAPQIHLVAAGSLLGLAMQTNASFPVGKVEFMELQPLSFTEFLEAMNEQELAQVLLTRDWQMSVIFHEKLMTSLRQYLYIGGMPEVVAAFALNRDWAEVRRIQHQLLNAYQSDFAKYATRDLLPRITQVWNSIPSQLAKENKKFFFNVLREGARAKDFELAIQWLLNSGLLLKSSRVKLPQIPLKAYEDFNVFKLYLVDVGLLGAMTLLSPQTIINGNSIFEEFKGALTEQYVRQQFQTLDNIFIGYWTNDRSTAEINFLIQTDHQVIQIEVKSGKNVRSKSLSEFSKKFSPPKAIRYSALPYRENEWMVNLPLYAVPYW